jgi:hypothetical protein
MKSLARLVTAMGVLTLLVAVLHFVMMPKLTGLIARAVGPRAEDFVVPIFFINHIGSGIFLAMLGLILIVTGMTGVRIGARWAAWSCLVYGAGFLVLVALLWLSLPPFFLSGLYFQLALGGLALVGLVVAVPVLRMWRSFR